MGKIVGITSYIIFVALVTFIVSGYARANQTFTFLDEQKENIYDNPNDLVIATLIANTQGQYDIYVKDSPVIVLNKEEAQFGANIYFIPVLLYQDANNFQYEMIVLMTDYENTDPNAFVSEEALQINIKLTFESNPRGLSQTVFDESFIQLYDDSMHMYALDQSYFIHPEEDVRIQSMLISYPTNLTDISIANFIHSEVYDDKNLQIPTDIDNDLIVLNQANLQLEEVDQRTSWYKNEDLLDQFKALNYMGYVYVGIELLIFIPITYLIFFRNNMKFLKKKKEELS